MFGKVIVFRLFKMIKIKSEDHVLEFGFSLPVGSGTAVWVVILVVNEPFISEFKWYNINNYDIQNIEGSTTKRVAYINY